MQVEWSPALWWGTTAGQAATGAAMSETTGVNRGTVVSFSPPVFATNSDPNSGDRQNVNALVFSVGANQTPFIVTPMRHDITSSNTTTAMYTAGNARGVAAVCIQSGRGDAAQVASGARATAIGSSCTANSSMAVAIGFGASVTAQNAVAIGPQPSASSAGAVAIGNSANASGSNSVALGGGSVTASGSAAIAIGEVTSATGAGSTAIGQGNTTNNLTRAVALGWTNTSVYQCTLSFGAHNFAAAGDAAFHLAQQCVETSTANPQEMLFREAGNQRVGVSVSTAIQFRCTVIGRQRAGAAGTINDVAGWSFEGVIKRAATGAPVLVGQTTVHTAADAGASAWTAVVSADTTNNALIVTVTGEANKTIRWLAYWQLTRVA
jgi:hypothetical protein